MRVLVIDDDELSRELLAMLLGSEGHEAEVAASGQEALDRLRAEGGTFPEVVLSDMQMPGLSSQALALALREIAGHRTRVLAMSGSQPAEAMLEDFDGFLLKPFSMEALDAVLAGRQETLNTLVEDTDAQTNDDRANPNAAELNEEIYVKMAKMMPAEQLAELYGMCLGDARERLGEMRRLAEAGDDAGYRSAAHTVKGGCGMIGAMELYTLAERAETDGLTCHSGPEIQSLLERFSRACDRLEHTLEERWQVNPAHVAGTALLPAHEPVPGEIIADEIL